MFVISHPSIETKSEQFPVFLSNDCWFFQYHIFLLTHFPNQTCVSGSHSLHTRSKMRCHPSCNSVHQALPLLLFSRDSFRIVPTTACSCRLQVLLLLSISIYIACSRQSFANGCLQLTELQDWISSQSYQFACSSAQCGGGGGAWVCEYELSVAQGQQEAWFLLATTLNFRWHFYCLWDMENFPPRGQLSSPCFLRSR